MGREHLRIGPVWFDGWGFHCSFCRTVFRCSKGATYSRCPEDRCPGSKKSFEVTPYKLISTVPLTALGGRNWAVRGNPLQGAWEFLIWHAFGPHDPQRIRLVQVGRTSPELREAIAGVSVICGAAFDVADEVYFQPEIVEAIHELCLGYLPDIDVPVTP